jgi:hypothetical protein
MVQRMINHKIKPISVTVIVYLVSYADNPQYSPTVHTLNLASALNVGYYQTIVQEQRNLYSNFMSLEISPFTFKYTLNVCKIYKGVVYVFCVLNTTNAPIPEAAPSNTWVCGRSVPGIAGSNTAGGMDVCLLRVLCVVR